MESIIDPENVFLIKLVNGETLVSNFHESEFHEEIYTLTYPILLTNLFSNQYKTINQLMSPWIHGSDNQQVNISSHDILTLTPTSPRMTQKYSQFLLSYLIKAQGLLMPQDNQGIFEGEDRLSDGLEETLAQYLQRQNRFLN